MLFCIAQVLLVSKWSVWWGGHCYGPRLLTDIVPCLMLLMLPAMDRISRGAILRLLFGLMLFAAGFVQAVGAFCYPNSGWDEAPVAIGESQQRLWNWKDNPVSRSLSAGPRLGPAPQFKQKIRRVFRASIRQDFKNLRAADAFHLRPKLFVGADLGGDVQNHREVPRLLQSQADFGFARFAPE